MRPSPAIALLALMLGLPIPAVAQVATPRDSTSVAASGDFAGLVDIGVGRYLYLECAGQGCPTVLLEAGSRSSATVWTEDLVQPDDPRPTVFAGVPLFTRVCAYERPGAAAVIDDVLQPSRSDPVPMPRGAESVVADLHALLIAEKSAHYVQLQQPELVIAAVQQVVDAVRDPGPWAVSATPTGATPAP